MAFGFGLEEEGLALADLVGLSMEASTAETTSFGGLAAVADCLEEGFASSFRPMVKAAAAATASEGKERKREREIGKPEKRVRVAMCRSGWGDNCGSSRMRNKIGLGDQESEYKNGIDIYEE